MATFLLNVIKQVAAQVKPNTPASTATTQAVTPFSQITAKPAAPTVTKPLQYTGPANDIVKTEDTTTTYGQAYQVQVYNADGTITTKTLNADQIVPDKTSQKVQQISYGAASASLQDSEAVLLKGANLSDAEVQAAILAGQKIDLAMTLKSKESTPLEINLLQTPSMKAELTYNFYQPDEANIAKQEDPTQDPFTSAISDAKVPLFVKLNWEPVDTLVECADFARKTAEEEAIVQQFLKPVRGVANGTTVDQQKVTNLLRQTNALSKDGHTLELVDTHDQQTAFNSISNGRIFKDSALTTINTLATSVNRVNFTDILLDTMNNGS